MSAEIFIEEGQKLKLDFQKLSAIGKAGVAVLPAVIQDAQTLEVLLIAYVNQEALTASLAEKRAIFFSTSRQELWRKGDTSGDVLDLVEIRVNCEQNSLLYLVNKRIAGSGACHTKDGAGHARSNCYYRRLISGEDLEKI